MNKPYKGSPTRKKFYAKRKQVRAARQRAEYLEQHTFWCKGFREVRGELVSCKWEVRFRTKAEGVTAVCRRCNTVHVYASPMTSSGPAGERWMTQAEYSESVPEPETVEVVELAEGKEVRLVDHAAWCSDRSKALYGARGEWQGAGKIVWRMGGRFWHTCLSSQAGRELAYARWGHAR